MRRLFDAALWRVLSSVEWTVKRVWQAKVDYTRKRANR